MTEKPVVEMREDGPLIVKHATGLQGPGGAEMETKEVMALCRCGQSKKKPFCDGSHNDSGFSSANQHDASGADREIVYDGDPISIAYNPRICSHAAECVRMSRAAFDPKRKPWCKPEEAGADQLEAIVEVCPSGALRAIRHEEDTHHIAERPTVIIQKDGPYWVTKADIDAQIPGIGGTKDKYVLCRCGLSGNKPYCDGSHFNQSWRDDS